MNVPTMCPICEEVPPAARRHYCDACRLLAELSGLDCSRCGRTLPRAEFWTRPTGRPAGECRGCNLARTRGCVGPELDRPRLNADQEDAAPSWGATPYIRELWLSVRASA